MSLSHLFLAAPIFLFAFALMEWVFQARRGQPGYNRRRSTASLQHSLEEAARLIAKNGFNQALLRSKGFRDRLDLLLIRSGHPFEWQADDFFLYKEISIVVTLSVLGALGLLKMENPVSGLAAWILAAIVSFMLPDLWLRIRGGSRKAQMQRQMPSFVDLMALAVDGGLDFTVAVERISDKMKMGPLRQELQVLLQESRLGSSRKEILQRWAFRTDLSDAQSLASLIIQSEEMGSPLANVLRNYAEDMRTRRILRAEEIAGKIPVKILFPMMVFFFPIVFVIILGPIALQFFQGVK